LINFSLKKIGKRNLALIITALTLAVLIAAYVIIGAVLNATAGNGDSSGSGGQSLSAPEYDASIGESFYGSNALAVPMVDVNKMTSITVDCHDGKYGMTRQSGENYYIFWYERDGKTIPYIPEIASKENDFDYTSLYAVDPTDSFMQTKLTKFSYGIGTLIFDYYVDLRQDDAATEVNERESQLKIYGLTEDEREAITVKYTGSDGSEKSYTVLIGNKLVSGSGYYFMIEGRDRIYSSVASSRLDLALGGFESFIHSRVVAKGLLKDKTFEPYLTTDFQQWKNTYVSEDGATVPDNSTVIIYTDVAYPVYSAASGELFPSDGYGRDGKAKLEIPLKEISSSVYSRVRAALIGATVDSDGENFGKATVINGMNIADVYDAESGAGVYNYEITAIESVLSDTEEIFTLGTPTLGYSLLKVTYNYTVTEEGEGGVLTEKGEDGCHAVIDISDAHFASVRSALASATVGTLSSPISLEIRYTEENSAKRSLTYRVTEISEIIKLGENGELVPLDKVTEDAIIYIHYETEITNEDGSKEIVEEGEDYYDLSKMKESDALYSIKAALLGRAVGGCNVSVKLGEICFQAFDDFVCYEIDRIEGFVTSEIVVAFSYLNTSERDAFYGEATFQNEIAKHDPTNPYAIYALNDDNCIKIARLLGGISGTTTNAVSEGLVGSETVAVGLTPEVMDRYYLYEGTTVYFELPRGIAEASQGSPDYKWASTLGFHLYISPVQRQDGEQFVYVGSDMYDIVVKMDASTFNFVNYSFPDFWARRNLAMVSSEDINAIDVQFNMTDKVGKYSFRFDHTTHYIRADGSHSLTEEENTTRYDWISVYPTIDGYVQGSDTVAGVYDKTLFSYYQSQYRQPLALHDIYNIVHKGSVTNMALSGHDSLATDCFKETLKMMYTTYYVGSLTEEEQAEALLGEAVMRIAFYVDESSTTSRYVYEFYRLDDRRVMVSFFKEARDGSSSTLRANAMYISDFAFKKIARAYGDMLNAKKVDADVGYDSES
jgi:hypothetical protein